MQFKVDENLHAEVAGLLCQHGHDALTVFDQNLRGCSDESVSDVCRREMRAIVTLGLDFADIRLFPPENYAGIIVLRIVDQSRPAVLKVMEMVINQLSQLPLPGHLWIADEVHIRVRPSPQGTPP